jgi:hypothetical protein
MSTTTSKKRLNFGLIGLVIAFVGLAIVGIVFLVRHIKEQKKLAPPTDSNGNETTSLGLDEVTQKQMFADIYNESLKYGFGSDAALAIAGQSAHESGRWTSKLATVDQNVFGMKDGGAGKGIQKGSDQGFATYNTPADSLQDLVEWMKAKGYPFSDDLTIEQHLQWLKSKQYFTDTLANYKKSVLSLINELKS